MWWLAYKKKLQNTLGRWRLEPHTFLYEKEDARGSLSSSFCDSSSTSAIFSKYASVKGKKGPFCSLNPLKCPLHSGAVPQRRGVLRSLPAGCPVLRARTAGGPVAQHSEQPEGFFNVTICQNFNPPSGTASRMFCSLHIKLTRPKFRTGYNVYVSFSHHPISVKSLEMFNLQHPSQNASNEVWIYFPSFSRIMNLLHLGLSSENDQAWTHWFGI